MALELIVYPKPPNPRLINHSPFCSKAEIFLKMSKLDFTIKELQGNPARFRNGKLPVLLHDDKEIPDSSFIQKYLEEEFRVNVDGHLSPQDAAQGFAFSKMMEEYFYWSALYERWFVDSNWRMLRPMFFGHIPPPVRNPVAGWIRKRMYRAALGQGVARHGTADILELGKESLKHLSGFIGEKDFLLGDRVSSFDSTIYAFVSSALHSPLGPVLHAEAIQYKNLLEYDERMFDTVYS